MEQQFRRQLRAERERCTRRGIGACVLTSLDLCLHFDLLFSLPVGRLGGMWGESRARRARLGMEEKKEKIGLAHVGLHPPHCRCKRKPTTILAFVGKEDMILSAYVS